MSASTVERPAKQPNKWWLGARPRTLPAAIVPVALGTAVASQGVEIDWLLALCALAVALALQIGTNYANDYSDGIRGTDAKRVGPTRLVASGLASPQSVKLAAVTAFALAGLFGLVLAIAVSWWLAVVGAASIAAGWFYTGGRKPYGYLGLGELFVFVFFGLVAVCGSQYVQETRITSSGVLAGVASGLLSMALLSVNNLRDRPNDALSGKRTVAVRVGDAGARWITVGCVFLPFVEAPFIPDDLTRLLFLLILPAIPAGRVVRVLLSGADGRHLIPVLQQTALTQMLFGFAMSIVLFFG